MSIGQMRGHTCDLWVLHGVQQISEWIHAVELCADTIETVGQFGRDDAYRRQVGV